MVGRRETVIWEGGGREVVGKGRESDVGEVDLEWLERGEREIWEKWEARGGCWGREIENDVGRGGMLWERWGAR